MMQQLSKAFNSTLEDRQRLNGSGVYAFRASPRPGYGPTNTETEALTGRQGGLWIDRETFQWVKVEAQVVRPVSIEGFLATVEPGTQFELEKMPVADSIRLPRHFVLKSRARVLLFFTNKQKEDDTFFDY